MYDFVTVERLQANDHVIENAPNLLLLHMLVFSLQVVYLRLQIAPVRELHHYAECLSAFFKKRFLISYDVRMLNGRQDPDLIQRIFLLFFIQLTELDL